MPEANYTPTDDYGFGKPYKPKPAASQSDNGPAGGDTGSDVKSAGTVANNRNEDEPTVAGFRVVSSADIIGDTRGDTGGSDSDGSDSIGSNPKRRGRRKGSVNRPKPEETTDRKAQIESSLAGLESMIFMGHVAIANVLSMPELAITDKEAESLSNATKKLAMYYAPQLNPRNVVWGEFLFAAGCVYVPRMVAIARRPRKAPQQPPTQPQRPPMNNAQAPVPQQAIPADFFTPVGD